MVFFVPLYMYTSTPFSVRTMRLICTEASWAGRMSVISQPDNAGVRANAVNTASTRMNAFLMVLIRRIPP